MKRQDRREQFESPAGRLRRWASQSPVPLADLFDAHGYLVSTGHLSRILGGTQMPGRHFAQAFYECTGVRLIPYLRA